jgi:hypothetical protein
MSFTVYGEHPGSGGHWEFARETAAGAVLKAADLISDGWAGVHISDDKGQNLLARSVRSALSREQPECLRGASPPANLRHARQRPTANPRLNPGVPTFRSLFFANPTPAPRPEILQAPDRGLPVDEGPR